MSQCYICMTIYITVAMTKSSVISGYHPIRLSMEQQQYAKEDIQMSSHFASEVSTSTLAAVLVRITHINNYLLIFLVVNLFTVYMVKLMTILVGAITALNLVKR